MNNKEDCIALRYEAKGHEMHLKTRKKVIQSQNVFLRNSILYYNYLLALFL